jgi:ribonuclease BN (tRNA processing enzyme)
MIHWLVMGAGGAVPTPTHNPAAYWVRIDGRSILLDPGCGALVRLVTSPHGAVSVDEIETVLLTHLHLDHCADLAPLLFALHSPLPRLRHPLQLIGPPGLAAYLGRLHDLYGSWLTPAKRELIVTELRPGQAIAPDNRQPPLWREGCSGAAPCVEAFAARHPQGQLGTVCLCFRFTDRQGHIAAFSGDTEPCEGLLRASRQADLLIVECSTPDQLATPGHMTPSRVGRLCAEARPRRVVLTHLYPPATALDLPALVGQHWQGPVLAARDGLLLSVPPAPEMEDNG